MSNSTSFARYYRPQSFDQLYGHASVVQTLKGAIQQNRLAQAYLFAGGHGTGKTSLARILAKILNCDQPSSNLEPCNQCNSCKEITQSCSIDVLEIDGASNRGIEDIRKIKDTIGYAAPRGRYKIYIIDEVHMLTKEAFNALLKTLEEPPEKAKFFFATTEPHKIPATILSRCQRFDLCRLSKKDIYSKLEAILKDKSLDFEKESIEKITTLANGSMRDAESLLDQVVSLNNQKLTLKGVESILSLPPTHLFRQFDLAFSQGDFGQVYAISDYMFTNGLDVRVFLEQFISHIQEHFKALIAIKGPSSQEISRNIYTKDMCLTALDWLVEAYDKFRYYPIQNLFLECLMLKIMRLRYRVALSEQSNPIQNSVVNAPSNSNKMQIQEQKAVVSKVPVAQPAKVPEVKQEVISSLGKEPHLKPQEIESLTASSEMTAEQASFLESNKTKPIQPAAQPKTQPIAEPASKQVLTKDDMNRFDTIMQFAAVEFAGKLQKKK